MCFLVSFEGKIGLFFFDMSLVLLLSHRPCRMWASCPQEEHIFFIFRPIAKIHSSHYTVDKNIQQYTPGPIPCNYYSFPNVHYMDTRTHGMSRRQQQGPGSKEDWTNGTSLA